MCVTCCKQKWHLGITSLSSVCPSLCWCYWNETSYVDRAEAGQAPCTRSITLASLFLELFPSVNFLKEPGQVTHVFRGTPDSSLFNISFNFVHGWVSCYCTDISACLICYVVKLYFSMITGLNKCPLYTGFIKNYTTAIYIHVYINCIHLDLSNQWNSLILYKVCVKNNYEYRLWHHLNKMLKEWFLKQRLVCDKRNLLLAFFMYNFLHIGAL